jgi:hypothetical protein
MDKQTQPLYNISNMKNLNKGFAHVILLIAIAILVVGGGVYYYLYSGPNVYNPATKERIDTKNCEKIANVEEKELCLSTQVRQTGDIATCSQISSRVFKDICIANVGLAKNDPSFCANAGQQKGSCYINILQNTKDPKICESKFDFPEDKDWCYVQLTILLNDKSYCQKVSDTKRYTNCW